MWPPSCSRFAPGESVVNYKIGDKIIYRYAFGVFCGEVVQVEGDLLKIRAKFNQLVLQTIIH